MSAISVQQVYDLALEIETDLAGLETPIDELLIEMRIQNRAMESGEASQKVSKAFPR
jgi:hypothetical protein